MNTELCPKIEAALSLISKKWIGLIIYTLSTGTKKFSEIEKFIPGLSARLLTERLKELEKQHIVKKNIINEDHIKIEYELTRKGIDLANSFKQLEEWAQKWN